MTDSQEQSSVTRRKYLTLAGGAAATAGLAGCTGEEAPTPEPTEGGGDTETETDMDTETETPTDEEFGVTITQGNLDSGLDPHDHRETTTDIIVMQMYEGALDRNREGGVVEALATDYERIEDGRVRLFIREGVTFHNGDELTPADVAFSYNRIVNEDVGGLASPQSDQLAGVESAEVVDGERAVDVLSGSVNPTVFGLLATYGDIVQQSWIEERETAEINSSANGTGPFQLDTYTADESVTYTKYEDYWDEPAAVDTITMNAATESSTRVNQLVSGETDITVNVPPQEVSRVRNEESTRIEAVPSTRVIYNAMRYDVEPFDSLEFRRAMNYAIDLESIIENVLSGFADATSQPTLQGFVGYNSDLDIYPYDVEQAESLVEESGYAGAEIELHTPVGRYLRDVEIAQAVAGYIDELSNVSCSVRQRDFPTLAGELTTGSIEDKPPFYLIGWGNATFDASQTLIPLLTTNGALSSWSNDEFDSLMDQSQDESDPDARDQLMQDANALANDQAPWIFLNRQYSVYGASNRIDWQARRDESIKAYEIEPAN
ncbi:ABC transporter substrate-binding protein [Salinirubrum litoreum]|uniref:ABC transporter substrate-binding protein n=1 Tax=Salinirubrum litoreum TaxID=1126234 RepID=A0ABD5R7R1_9EURY|nr:ABC transporter substrate-binding protein [Salinirubrum litoreum]